MCSQSFHANHPLLIGFLLVSIIGCQNQSINDNLGQAPPSPFTELDTIAANDWWNRKWNPIIEVKVSRDSVIAFAAYTVANGTLKLSAQLYPLYPNESPMVHLELERDGEWVRVQSEEVNPIGWSTLFRVEEWDDSQDVSYQIRHGEKAKYTGLIRKNPIDKEEIILAALSCNSNKDRGDRDHYVRNIEALDPDLIFFAGDQSYDHKEHTAAWLKFGVQFKETFRNRPMISIPDDHDIGQGNLWGEGGKIANRIQGDDGGYYYHHEYIKMVERCQTAHLPDPFDPTPIKQGIGVYFTNLRIGKVDFAIIEDRKFKSGPNGKIPQQGPRPDHIRNPGYNPASVDVPGLQLLGERQLAFLEAWGKDTVGVAMKAVLSQTGFCGGAHIHGQLDNRLHADMDSNGWPQSGRNKALRAIKAANAVHIAGDQHLATVIQHGIDEFRDGPWAFVVPAVVNNYYSRWWWPADEKAGDYPFENIPLPWTGNYRDGFDNRITMHAYANPDTRDQGAGFGLIRFSTVSKTVTFECYPRTVDVKKAPGEQFPGWPVVVNF
ncbi:MAG: alkaline phosphatase D family protein [Bacteroidota bacterium]